MAIHREGYKIIAVGFIILLIINIIAGIMLPDKSFLKWMVLLLSLSLYVFILFFFRLPSRQLQPDPGLIYAPADGKVVVIEEPWKMNISKTSVSRYRYSCRLSTCTATGIRCRVQ